MSFDELADCLWRVPPPDFQKFPLSFKWDVTLLKRHDAGVYHSVSMHEASSCIKRWWWVIGTGWCNGPVDRGTCWKCSTKSEPSHACVVTVWMPKRWSGRTAKGSRISGWQWQSCSRWTGCEWSSLSWSNGRRILSKWKCSPCIVYFELIMLCVIAAWTKWRVWESAAGGSRHYQNCWHRCE